MKSRLNKMQAGVLSFLALVLCLGLFFAGCGNEDNTENPDGDNGSSTECTSDFECYSKNPDEVCCAGQCVASDQCNRCDETDECRIDEDCGAGSTCDENSCSCIGSDCKYDSECGTDEVCCSGTCTTVANCNKCSDSDQCIMDSDCSDGKYCNNDCECATKPQAPDIEIEPYELDFGYVTYNDSKVETLYIHNYGGANLEIFLMEFSADTPDAFQWVYVDDLNNHESPTANDKTIVVAPGGSEAFTIAVTSIENKAYEGYVDIVTNDTSENGGKYRVKLYSRLSGETTLEVTPTGLYYDFGDVEVDTENPAQVKITLSSKHVDKGNKVLSVGPLQWSPAQSSDFFVETGYDMNAVNMLQFGDSTSFFVMCLPRSEGSKTITLSVNHDADFSPTNSSPTEIMFTCNGVKPVLGITPDVGEDPRSFNYGNVTVGNTQSQKFTLTSARAGVVKMKNISLSGDMCSAFSLIGASQAAVAEIDPTSSGVSFRVTYSPPSLGTHSCNLKLESNSYESENMVIVLSGNGVTSNPRINPAELAFGDVLLNSADEKSFTITNNGTGELEITAMTIIDPDCESCIPNFSFSTANLSFPVVIESGDDPEEFSITYNPSSKTEPNDNAVLKIYTNNTEFPVLQVPLSGRAVWPACRFTLVEDSNFTDTIDFGSVSLNGEGQRHLKIDNQEGGYNCVIESISFGPNTSLRFSYTPELLPAIAPDSSKEVEVSFNPVDVVGEARGSLIFKTNNLENNVVEVKLEAVSVYPQILITPVSAINAPVVFEDVLINTCSELEVFSIRNVGQGNLEIYDKDLDGLYYKLRETVDGTFLITEWSIPELTEEGVYKLRPYSGLSGTNDEILFSVQFCPNEYDDLTLKAELEISSNDVHSSTSVIYLSGAGKGCDPCKYNHDAEPGCEYTCNGCTYDMEFPAEKCDYYPPEAGPAGIPIDNDCDGEANEGYGIGNPCLGVGECADGVKECDPDNVFGTICSTSIGGSQYTGVAETCDGKDNDCDGETDEIFAVGYPCLGEGACGEGVIECDPNNVNATICSSDPGGSDYDPEARKEICDGLDNDCDGITDNGAFYIWGVTPLTTCNNCVGNYCTGTGECAAGVYECMPVAQDPTQSYIRCCSDFGGSCSVVKREYCDEKDNNCDGLTDEGYGKGDSCDGTGECSLVQGVKECDPNNKETTICSVDIGGSNYQGTEETCDHKDNDCDGLVDEDFNIGAVCYGKGICGEESVGEGEMECNDLHLIDPTQPISICSTGKDGSHYAGTDEICNGKDDNCDGIVDNIPVPAGKPEVGMPCDGVGECGIGIVECIPDTTRTRCSTDIGGSKDQSKDELCDGRDNDCDTEIDEDFEIGIECDGEGECGPGTYICVTNTERKCSSEIIGSGDVQPEICDGKDNDCDGIADEDFFVGSACAGVGECSDGQWECAGTTGKRCSTNPGGSQYDANAVERQEVCDGKDNDCDGFYDNGINFCSDDGYDAIDHCGGCGNVCVVQQGTPVCANDGNDLCFCAIESCNEDYFDTNGLYTDGCECKNDTNDVMSDTKGDTCSEAIALSPEVLTDKLTENNHKATISGNLADPNDVDWYTFTAQDWIVSSEDKYHVTITLINNPTGEVVMDIFTGGCSSSGTLVCGATKEYKHAEDSQWEPGQSDPIWGKGHNPCGMAVDSPDDRNYCDEKVVKYYVRVYRSLSGSERASCGVYTLEATNAEYSSNK